MNKLPHIALSLMALLFGPQSLAQNKDSKVEIQVEGGAQYDSTLAVVELDQTSNKSDWASLFNGRIGGQFQPSKRLTLKGGYRYASRDYRQQNRFDQELHTLAADAGFDFGGMTLGASHHFAHARLASDPFLNLNKTSLYAGKLFNKGVYLRAAASGTRKRFDNTTERDTDGAGLTVDAYYFMNGARSFWSLGLGGETEDAKAPEFDNRALKLRARYSHKGRILGHSSRLQLGWRYLNRDYSHETPSLERSRYDRSQVVEAIWSLGLTEHLMLESKIEYGDYRSNLETADYQETSASILLSAEF